MSRILAFTAAVTLLSLSACGGSSENTVAPPAPPPAAETTPAPAQAQAPAAEKAPAPETGMAMTPAEPAKMAAKPEAPAAMQKMEKPAMTMKPAEPEPVAKPAAPMEAAAPAPAMKPAATGAPSQDEVLAIAKRGNCLTCHKIEGKLVGPAWKDVGAKYKGDAKAAATIASHIKAGGKFGWNFGSMPARGGSKITDAEVETLARFIASLK